MPILSPNGKFPGKAALLYQALIDGLLHHGVCHQQHVSQAKVRAHAAAPIRLAKLALGTHTRLMFCWCPISVSNGSSVVWGQHQTPALRRKEQNYPKQ